MLASYSIHSRFFGRFTKMPAHPVSTAAEQNQSVEENDFGGKGQKSIPEEADIRLKPWKYVGYKGYSAFISSDDDFFILRRFDTLNVRVALSQQDELSSLETELIEMDEKFSRKDSEDIDNGTFRGDLEERTALLANIARKVRRYSKSP